MNLYAVVICIWEVWKNNSYLLSDSELPHSTKQSYLLIY